MIITQEYRELNRQLHKDSEAYGTSGAKWREFARQLSDWGRLAILDFGAGKCTLAKALGPAYRVTSYDPCIEGLDTPPEPHDVVVCGDVMEHIEPDLVDNVLKEVRRLTLKRALFVIALQPAVKTLADGRNAHLSIHSQGYWRLLLIKAGFKVVSESKDDPNAYNAWYVCE